MSKSVENLFSHIDAKRVKVLLAEREWNVSDLARSIDLAPQTVHNILAGRRPYTKLIPRIAEALGVPLKKILIKTERVPKRRSSSAPQNKSAA
jgi:transcriptional regulator with XRE-family HTH domain